MQEAVKKLFDAPFAVMGDAEDYTKFNVIISSPNSPRHCCTIASCVDRKTAIRFARLPELYDALADAAERVCRKCVAFWFPGQKIDFPEDFADFTCPITKAGCFCENWLNLLKKVKDGK